MLPRALPLHSRILFDIALFYAVAKLAEHLIFRAAQLHFLRWFFMRFYA